ncbi:MAG: hypothetical protein FWG65_12835 [Turicibacter sp.]|nr:hypothetical protein [Turicibacter sp.]
MISAKLQNAMLELKQVSTLRNMVLNHLPKYGATDNIQEWIEELESLVYLYSEVQDTKTAKLESAIYEEFTELVVKPLVLTMGI